MIDQDRRLARKVLWKPSLPTRVLYPLHQTLPERRGPQPATIVFQAGQRREATVIGAVLEFDARIQASDCFPEKPELLPGTGKYRAWADGFRTTHALKSQLWRPVLQQEHSFGVGHPELSFRIAGNFLKQRRNTVGLQHVWRLRVYRTCHGSR